MIIRSVKVIICFFKYIRILYNFDIAIKNVYLNKKATNFICRLVYSNHNVNDHRFIFLWVATQGEDETRK